MKFRIERETGRLIAVLDDGGSLRRWLLAQLRLSPTRYAIELLHDIARVEVTLNESYSQQDLRVYVGPFLERVSIQPFIPDDEVEMLQLEIPLSVAKSLLFEWGALLERFSVKSQV